MGAGQGGASSSLTGADVWISDGTTLVVLRIEVGAEGVIFREMVVLDIGDRIYGRGGGV